MPAASHLSPGEQPQPVSFCSVFVSSLSQQMSTHPCLGSRGRCQSHAYLFPRLRARPIPSSCRSPPAAAACHGTAVPPTTGRCQSRWWPFLLRASSRSSSTLDTASRACPQWGPRVSLHSTPWPLNRSLVTSAWTLVSSLVLTAVFVQTNGDTG